MISITADDAVLHRTAMAHRLQHGLSFGAFGFAGPTTPTSVAEEPPASATWISCDSTFLMMKIIYISEIGFAEQPARVYASKASHKQAEFRTGEERISIATLNSLSFKPLRSFDARNL